MRRSLFVLILVGSAASSTAYAIDGDADGYDSSVDCNDADAAFHPGALEGCSDPDYNCDGFTGTVDNDQDGFAACEGDCNDGDATVNPDADEVCGDGVDNDCDGATDDATAVDAVSYFPDADGDGFGDDAFRIDSCTWPGLGFVQVGGDCDDTEARVRPGGIEVCDGLDNDCVGGVDDGIPVRTHYFDRDLDGFGDPNPMFTVVLQCPPTGYSPFPTDCDDNDAAVHPLITVQAQTHAPLADAALEATEADRDLSFVADGIDQDCDGFDVCFPDLDGDGFGEEPGPGEEARFGVDNDLDCANGSTTGMAGVPGDCDDGDPNTFPGATEVPGDGLDQDCDGREFCYRDLDGDGFGIGVVLGNLACSDAQTAAYGGDCNDDPSTGAAINPIATELCDGIDNDCDGAIDEVSSPTALTWYLDEDGDGYGVDNQGIRACGTPVGFAAVSGDCDDLNPFVNPGEHEVCANAIDDNCDGMVDGCGDTSVDTGYLAGESEEGGGCGGWGASYGHMWMLPLLMLGRRRTLLARV